MTDARLFAWILVSAPEHDGTLKDLIAQADAIMRMTPTQDELQKALGWLIHRDLVQAQSGRYSRTFEGRQLLDRRRIPGQRAIELLNATALAFGRLPPTAASLHELAAEEVANAYKDYQDESRAALKESSRRAAAKAPPSLPVQAQSQTPASPAVTPPKVPNRPKEPNLYDQWRNQDGRKLGGYLLLIGVAALLFAPSGPYPKPRGRGMPFVGWLMTFWGIWSLVTNLPKQTEEKLPLWWKIGSMAITLLALWISL